MLLSSPYHVCLSCSCVWVAQTQRVLLPPSVCRNTFSSCESPLAAIEPGMFGLHQFSHSSSMRMKFPLHELTLLLVEANLTILLQQGRTGSGSSIPPRAAKRGEKSLENQFLLNWRFYLLPETKWDLSPLLLHSPSNDCIFSCMWFPWGNKIPDSGAGTERVFIPGRKQCGSVLVSPTCSSGLDSALSI